MKINEILIGLSLLMMCFVYSCTEDLISPDSKDDKVALLKKKPDKPGKPGGGTEVVYDLIYQGFLDNTRAYALETVNNKKREAMDTPGCDKSADMTGIDALANSVISTCTSLSGTICFNTGINLNKGKQNPGRVRVLVQFEDPAICNQNIASIWMFGYIDGVANPDPMPTLFPGTGETVTIIFDEWYLDACDLCATGTNQIRNTFSGTDQILEITIAASGETCAEIPCS